MNIKKYKIQEYFKNNNYSYEDKGEYDLINHITYFTKTRHVDKENGDFKSYKMNWGCEQPFLIRSIAKKYKSKNFFEIGTGRGTACYSLCNLSNIENITTVDIIPFEEKRNYAIGYKNQTISMKDIHNLIDIDEKKKINFLQRDQKLKIHIDENKNKYDLFFIDGSHEDPRIIFNDFQICMALAKNNSVILWDDYNDKFQVKPVVDYIVNNYSQEIGIQNLELISFKGHLFDHMHRNAEKEKEDSGVLIMELSS